MQKIIRKYVICIDMQYFVLCLGCVVFRVRMYAINIAWEWLRNW